MSEENPNLEVNGLWDLASGQALQAFLKSQARKLPGTPCMQSYLWLRHLSRDVMSALWMETLAEFRCWLCRRASVEHVAWYNNV